MLGQYLTRQSILIRGIAWCLFLTTTIRVPSVRAADLPLATTKPAQNSRTVAKGDTVAVQMSIEGTDWKEAFCGRVDENGEIPISRFRVQVHLEGLTEQAAYTAILHALNTGFDPSSKNKKAFTDGIQTWVLFTPAAVANLARQPKDWPHPDTPSHLLIRAACCTAAGDADQLAACFDQSTSGDQVGVHRLAIMVGTIKIRQNITDALVKRFGVKAVNDAGLDDDFPAPGNDLLEFFASAFFRNLAVNTKRSHAQVKGRTTPSAWIPHNWKLVKIRTRWLIDPEETDIKNPILRENMDIEEQIYVLLQRCLPQVASLKSPRQADAMYWRALRDIKTH